MPRYIDSDAFEADCRKRYCTGCENYNGIKCKSCWVADMLDEIENAPTLSPDDVRGVVRCKDCTFGESATDGGGNPCVLCGNSMVFDYPYAHDPDWFCADGEMKGAEDGTTDNA